VLSQVEGVGAVQVAVAMESTGKKQVEKDSPEDTSTSSEKGDSGTQRSSQTVTTGETTVYVDRSNKKYHSKPNCSGMKNPKSIPISQAKKKYTACKKCCK